MPIHRVSYTALQDTQSTCALTWVFKSPAYITLVCTLVLAYNRWIGGRAGRLGW